MTTSEKRRTITQQIDTEWCKGCGICVHFCPKDVLELDRHGKAVAARPDDCIACMLCEIRCPDLAIQIIKEDDNER
ncbi:MAG: ferredoxin family protein [Desulfobacterales bacterium]|nr:ferredoxin family protein [Desulfobacterales bacterium]